MTEHVTDKLVVPVHVEQDEIEQAKEGMRELRRLAKKATASIDAAVGRQRRLQNTLPDDDDVVQALRGFVTRTAKNQHATPAELDAMAKVARLFV